MYNLLMITGHEDNIWQNNEKKIFPMSRIFEYTEDAVEEKYKNNLNALIKLPCLFCYEGFDSYGQIGSITKLKKIKKMAGYGSNQKLEPHIEIEYTLDKKMPIIPISSLEDYQNFGVGCGDNDCEIHRIHWAVKDINIFKAICINLSQKYEPFLKEELLKLNAINMKKIWSSEYKSKKLIFISHRDKDKKNVSTLAKYLEKNLDVKTFIAHEDIGVNQLWSDEIQRALRTMDLFLCLATDTFHNGSWTDQEIGYAIKMGTPILYVKLGKASPKGFVSFKQALSCNWNNAGEEIVSELGEMNLFKK